MRNYNQKLQKGTYYACSLYSMLNIIKFDFGVEVPLTVILRIVAYMGKIGALLPKGAYFAIIYPAMVKFIEFKTGFKLGIDKSTISGGLDKKHTWTLGFKKANKLYSELNKDGFITRQDFDKIKAENSGYGHNHAVKFGKHTKKRIIIESLYGRNPKTTLPTLKYAQKIGLYYDTARTLVADKNDKRTVNAQKILLNHVNTTGKLVSWEEFKKIDFK